MTNLILSIGTMGNAIIIGIIFGACLIHCFIENKPIKKKAVTELLHKALSLPDLRKESESDKSDFALLQTYTYQESGYFGIIFVGFCMLILPLSSMIIQDLPVEILIVKTIAIIWQLTTLIMTGVYVFQILAAHKHYSSFKLLLQKLAMSTELKKQIITTQTPQVRGIIENLEFGFVGENE